jgi:hypothetical protein
VPRGAGRCSVAPAEQESTVEDFMVLSHGSKLVG